jgi:hypothetical protein
LRRIKLECPKTQNIYLAPHRKFAPGVAGAEIHVH